MTPPFTAVIFDMDGVLVDSEPMHADTARAVLAPFGVAYTEQDNARYFGFTDAEMFGDLIARHGLTVTVDEMVRRRGALVVARTWQHPNPMDGVPDVLHALHTRGRRLALASSSSVEVIGATIDALRIRALFETVVSGTSVGRGKPAPDIFVETARRLGLPPAACLVVEDSRNGLLAAKAAGMACAAVPCGATRGERFDEADYRLGALPELLAILA